jgi:CheY-like chemotaxis protein
MKGRILVVDDDPVAMGMLEDALKLGGFEVLRAYGAEDALRKVKLRKPDVVLTDLEMPKVNGVELIAMIREDPDIQRTPIFAVTSHTWDTVGQAAAQVGCDAFISKPFAPQELIRKVEECLATRHAAPAPPPQPPPGVEGSKPVAAPSPGRGAAAVPHTRGPTAGAEDTGTIFDRVAFLEYVAGNLAHARRAIGMLLDSLPDRLENIRKAIASQHSEALRLTAHSFKGAVAFFAAPAVVAVAFRLEMMGCAGDLTSAGGVYFDLERECARLVQALNEFVREVGSAPAAPKAADEQGVKLHLVRGR